MKKIIKAALYYMMVTAFMLTSCSLMPSSKPTTLNVEHLAKLQEGVTAWNTWRKENPGIKPNLIKAQLKKMDLKRYNLRSAILQKADLQGAYLNRAKLNFASLVNADLRNAHLLDADLTKANLKNAKLTGAKYNSATKWPAGFDPVAAGAVLVP